MRPRSEGPHSVLLNLNTGPPTSIHFRPGHGYDAFMTPDLFDHFPMRNARMHEAFGASAFAFAFALAGHMAGPVMWIRESWQTSAINPSGFSRYLDPQRMLLALGRDQVEVLAIAEEALRSGAVPLVVMESGKELGLTAARRLQLAAKAGNATGLCLLCEGMGSNAAETRWRCQPVFDASNDAGDSTLQSWSIIKNKSGTLGSWDVRWDAKTRRIIVVSPSGKRPGSKGMPA